MQRLDNISKTKNAAKISTQTAKMSVAAQITPMPPQGTGMEAENNLGEKRNYLRMLIKFLGTACQ